MDYSSTSNPFDKPISKHQLLDIIFRDPEMVCDESCLGDHSLHLLRREILNCLNLGQIITQENYWSATLAILSGMDLLSNIYSKKSLLELSNPEDRVSTFYNFCIDFNRSHHLINTDQYRLLKLFRNTFVHNLGLFCFDDHGTPFQFGLSPDKGSSEIFTLERGEETRYILHIYRLNEVFEKMVSFSLDILQNLPAKDYPEILHELGYTIWIKMYSGTSASVMGNYVLMD